MGMWSNEGETVFFLKEG